MPIWSSLFSAPYERYCWSWPELRMNSREEVKSASASWRVDPAWNAMSLACTSMFTTPNSEKYERLASVPVVRAEMPWAAAKVTSLVSDSKLVPAWPSKTRAARAELTLMLFSSAWNVIEASGSVSRSSGSVWPWAVSRRAPSPASRRMSLVVRTFMFCVRSAGTPGRGWKVPSLRRSPAVTCISPSMARKRISEMTGVSASFQVTESRRGCSCVWM
mmetsp:Transcript_10025/g.40768  ORF Transcript_10025/g.40768 Transcript_10025/m.40768 type:complete len:217 (-) Transcript_10025:2785-3435(-)